MSAPAPAVEVRDLRKSFGAFRAVDGVSFDVARGEIFGFLGPNGAGKSTTIKMLCGLLTPTSGTGRIGGMDVARDGGRIRARIGYMSQRFSLYDELCVEENVRFFGALYGLSAERLEAACATALDRAGLAGRGGEQVRTLPLGVKQRLALACAILHGPEFLFLDEPTSGVDPATRRRFWNLIHEVARGGVTVFVTTHYMEEAEYCDRLVLIYRGRIVLSGRPADLKRDEALDRLHAVSAVPPQAALAALSGAPGISEANLFGDRVHAASPLPAPEAVRAVRAALGRAGLAAAEVVAVAPSLEDVFVLAIARADREGAA